MQSKFKIFIPGGTGFLGKHILEKLKASGTPYVSSSLSQGVDFRNLEQTERIFKENKIDAVINCAAYVGGISWGYSRPAEIFFNNILISTYLIELAHRHNIRRFVNPISNCSYPGHINSEFKEENWWDGELHESVLTYGFVRKASWVQTWGYYKQYGMEFVNLILPNMYGPGDHFEENRSHALGALIKKIADARREDRPEVIVWGTGSPIREWLFVEDAADVLIASVSAAPSVAPINIGVNKGISIRDLVYLIKEAVGYKGRIVFDITKPNGAPFKTMNNTKMIKHFMGWVPPTGLVEGIEKTVKWYNKNYRKIS